MSGESPLATLSPDLFRSISLETESRGLVKIPANFSKEAVLIHKILLGDAGFAEVNVSKDSMHGFLYPRDAVLVSLKKNGREFLRLSENDNIWQRAVNTVNAHGGWTLTMLFLLLEKLHRVALKFDSQ